MGRTLEIRPKFWEETLPLGCPKGASATIFVRGDEVVALQK